MVGAHRKSEFRHERDLEAGERSLHFTCQRELSGHQVRLCQGLSWDLLELYMESHPVVALSLLDQTCSDILVRHYVLLTGGQTQVFIHIQLLGAQVLVRAWLLPSGL